MDKKLKEQVMKKAKQEGSNLSSVFKNVARAYVRNEFSVGLAYNPKLIKAIKQSEKDVKAGRVYYGDLRELIKKVK